MTVKWKVIIIYPNNKGELHYMKVSNILITVALVLGLGGVAATTVVGVNGNKGSEELKSQIEDLQSQIDTLQHQGDVDKAEIEAAYVALIEKTRDDLMAAFQAADSTLEASIASAKAELKAADEKLAQDFSASDAGIALAIQSKMEDCLAMIEELGGNIEAAEGDVTSVVNAVSTILNSIIDQINTLGEGLQEVAAAYSSVASTLSSMISVINSMSNTVGLLESALDSLQNQLDANYYTTDQIDGFLSAITDTTDYLISLFQDGDGDVVSVAAMLSDLSAEFEEVKAKLLQFGTDIETNKAAIEELTQNLSDINDVLSAFNGEAAKETKGGYVNELSLYYSTFKDDVIDMKYREIDDSYADRGGIPNNYKELFIKINSLYNTTLRAIADEGMSRIILAADVNEAKEQLDEYKLRLKNYMLEIDFLFEKEAVMTRIPEFKTETLHVNFTDAEVTHYLDKVDAIEFDSNELDGKSANEAREYYEGLIADLELVEDIAEGYNTLVNNLETALVDVNIYADTATGLLSVDQIAYFTGLEIDACGAAAYEAANDTIDDADEIQDYLDAKDELFTVVAKGTEEYNNIVERVNTAKTEVGTYTDMSSTDQNTLQGLVDAIANFDNYKTVVEGQVADVDPDAAATAFEAETSDADDKATNLELTAEAWNAIVVDEAASVLELNDNTNLSSTEIGYFASAMNIYTLSDLLAEAATYGTDDASFDNYVAHTGDVFDDIVDMCGVADDMKATYNELVSDLSDTSVAGYDYNAYFTKLAGEAYDNYQIFDDSGLKENVDLDACSGIQLSSAQTASSNLSSDADDISAAINTLKTAVLKGESLATSMNTYVETQEAVYEAYTKTATAEVGSDGNPDTTGATVWATFADDILAAEAQYGYTYGGTNFDALPTLTGDYDDDKAAMDDYISNIESNDVISQRYADFVDAMDDITENAMLAFKDAEDAYTDAWLADLLGDALDGSEGSFKDWFDGQLALVTDEQKKMDAADSFKSWVLTIKMAENSKSVELLLAKAKADINKVLNIMPA